MDEEKIEHLIEKLLLDKDFEQLEDKLNRFNFFNVLNISHREYVVSSGLRWLLDPKESHGFGDYFLKKLLIEVILMNKDNKHYNKETFSVINLDTINLTDSFVQTEEILLEKRRGDLSITDERNSIYVLIENKIYAKEGEDQTTSYVKAVKEIYPDIKYYKLFIYLSLDGSEAEAQEFLTLSYSTLVKVLKELLDAKKTLLAQGPIYLLEQFIGNIEENLLEESDMDELCERLYLRHKTAIEQIYQAKPSNRQFYEHLGKTVSSKLGDDWNYKARGSYSAIFKKEWREKLNPDKDFPIVHYEFGGLPDRLSIFLHAESWETKDLNKLFRKNLNKTELSEKTKIDIGKSGSILNITIRRNIPFDNIEITLNEGINKMMELINDTYNYVDQAVSKTHIV